MDEERKLDSELVETKSHDAFGSVDPLQPAVKRRTVKMTEKGLLDKIDFQQRERSGRFKKASSLKEAIVGLM